MINDEMVLVAFIMLVSRNRTFEFLNNQNHIFKIYLHKLDISAVGLSMHSEANIIQNRHDARWFLTLNKINNDLVIKVINRRPLDPFPKIFLLLGFKRQLNEYLL
jgi:hypothetical protein